MKRSITKQWTFALTPLALVLSLMTGNAVAANQTYTTDADFDQLRNADEQMRERQGHDDGQERADIFKRGHASPGLLLRQQSGASVKP